MTLMICPAVCAVTMLAALTDAACSAAAADSPGLGSWHLNVKSGYFPVCYPTDD
jgi:hypothetical protein